MLQSLHVKNLALIDESEVEFTDGLNILSGETGAGKSIIIGSINLALGEKVQKEMLRENADYALVELIFQVTDEKRKAMLKELDVFPEEDTVILSRKITGGRGVARVNGESVPVSKIKEIASVLIDIHGQHEHQSLLSKKSHLKILDEYAREAIGNTKEKLKESYHTYKTLADELAGADKGDEERVRELSFLEYEIKEIEEAAVKEGEDEELEADYKRYANGKKIMEALINAHGNTADAPEAASEQIGRALREIMSVSEFDERIKGFEEQLLEVDNLLNDFNRELASYLDETDFDEATFYEIEKRLDVLNNLKAKYGGTLAEVLASLEKKQLRAEKLRDYDGYLEKLRADVDTARQNVEKLSKKLSDVRRKYAKKLTEEITRALSDLNFIDVRFTMEFSRTKEYTADGYDDAEFLISTNPGEPIKPLGKVASGGELSRIMLAIKTVLADRDDVETLIFDEIDSGISGRTAQMVSEKINLLGRNHQIICITHLPQIAAMADSHYLIQKSVEKKQTVSHIRRLSDAESADELARMLGGVEITEKVRESAREMKALAAGKKK